MTDIHLDDEERWIAAGGDQTFAEWMETQRHDATRRAAHPGHWGCLTVPECSGSIPHQQVLGRGDWTTAAEW